jgi:hypothetical protein
MANVACVFATFLVGFAFAWWFNNLHLIPALQSIRQPVIGLFLSLWIGAYVIFYRRMGRVERTVDFFLFSFISLFSSFFLLAVSGGFVKNCEVTERVNETEMIYVCELNGSGSGMFRAVINDPVMELISWD